jgi:hypothetical protein
MDCPGIRRVCREGEDTDEDAKLTALRGFVCITVAVIFSRIPTDIIDWVGTLFMGKNPRQRVNHAKVRE